MTIRRDERGRYVSDPGDDTFITISNEQIYKQLIDQGELLAGVSRRVARIEDHMTWTSRLWTSLTTVFIAGSAVISGVYYVRH